MPAIDPRSRRSRSGSFGASVSASTQTDARGVLSDAAGSQLALGCVAAACGASSLAVVAVLTSWAAVCAGCAVLERFDGELGAPHVIPATLVRLYSAGEKLPFTQRQIEVRGHAIECRINAEDPYKFTPSPGRVTTWHAPGGPGVRVDSHVYTNYFVPPNYDSMVGKIIVHGDTREQAMARMRTALAETVVEGINTNIALHRELMVDAKFMNGGTNIHYLEQWLDQRKR